MTFFSYRVCLGLHEPRVSHCTIVLPQPHLLVCHHQQRECRIPRPTPTWHRWPLFTHTCHNTFLVFANSSAEVVAIYSDVSNRRMALRGWFNTLPQQRAAHCFIFQSRLEATKHEQASSYESFLAKDYYYVNMRNSLGWNSTDDSCGSRCSADCNQRKC